MISQRDSARWGALGGEIRASFPEQAAPDLVLEPAGSFSRWNLCGGREGGSTLGRGHSKHVTEGQG